MKIPNAVIDFTRLHLKRTFQSALLIAVVLIAVNRAAAAEPTSAAPRRGPQQQLVSPEVNPDRTVTFRVRATGATNVSVLGEWPGGGKAMTNDGSGNWSVTVGPLEPDLYGYSLSINGFQTL